MIKNKRLQNNRTAIRIASLFLLYLLLPSSQAYAAPVEDEAFFYKPKNHVEVAGTFEHLKPQETYGDWKTGRIQFSRDESPSSSWFVGYSKYDRKNDGRGQQFEAGTYIDWTDSFYTYTGVSTGSNCTFLPKLRIDQDFNFKFGSKKDLVWTIGDSYIEDYGSDMTETGKQSFNTISTGLTYYSQMWNYGYRVFRNVSHPGSLVSYSHLFSIGYGKEGKYMTSLSYTFGKEAVLDTQAYPFISDSNDSKLVTLNHRRWLGLSHDYGYFTEISWLDVENGYRSVGCEIGIFKDF